jgi:hypothetical protein
MSVPFSDGIGFLHKNNYLQNLIFPQQMPDDTVEKMVKFLSMFFSPCEKKSY